MSNSNYLFDNAASEARQRFGALSALFDPTTFRHIEALNIGQGCRCWEVGAGGPTVSNWLADRVGASGRVLATDINTSWVSEHLDHTVEVLQHDVTQDDPPAGQFDLVHARLVLSHLPARGKALRRMVASLRPGGWLLVEDFDKVIPVRCIDAYLPEHHRANKLHAGVYALLAQRGADLEYARRLPRIFRDAGLTQVGADAYLPVAIPAGNVLSVANITQVRDALIEQQLATQDEIDAHVAAMADATITVGTPPLISAWGQRA
jgi:ubiquinone/menaquinone biosynthesis C-methylase UbiE